MKLVTAIEAVTNRAYEKKGRYEDRKVACHARNLDSAAWVYRHDNIQGNCTYRFGVFWSFLMVSEDRHIRLYEADIND
jgi:hypothetical protein